MDTPRTIIFFGRSGSGKGTQAKILRDLLKEFDPKRETLYIETGEQFREFAKKDSYTSKLTQKVMNEGGLMPAFMPIWVWTDYLIKNFSGEEHLILDGLSRKPEEAPILESALAFYGREKGEVIYLNTSKEWSKEHLLKRNRSDDNIKDIEARLTWFDEEAFPAMMYFKNKGTYNFHEINGEQNVEEVTLAIQSALKLPSD